MKKTAPTTKTKSKKNTKKHFRLLLILLPLLLAGSAYFYYILVYRVKHEPEPASTATVSEPLFTLKTQRHFLSLFPEVKRPPLTDGRPKLIMEPM